MACYGFAVWDVGQNRLLIRHGGLIGKGAEMDTVAASHHALVEGLGWLVRQGEHRRRIVISTDNPMAYAQLQGEGAIGDLPYRALTQEVKRTLGLFPQHSLQLIPETRNRQAIEAADDAYVEAQEAERLARVAEVLPELQHAGGAIYMVGDRYRVDIEAGTCSCPDFRVHSERHPIRCKHLLAALQMAGRYRSEGRERR
jgi:hypothetical protein